MSGTGSGLAVGKGEKGKGSGKKKGAGRGQQQLSASVKSASEMEQYIQRHIQSRGMYFPTADENITAASSTTSNGAQILSLEHNPSSSSATSCPSVSLSNTLSLTNTLTLSSSSSSTPKAGSYNFTNVKKGTRTSKTKTSKSMATSSSSALLLPPTINNYSSQNAALLMSANAMSRSASAPMLPRSDFSSKINQKRQELRSQRLQTSRKGGLCLTRAVSIEEESRVKFRPKSDPSNKFDENLSFLPPAQLSAARRLSAAIEGATEKKKAWQ